MGIQALKSFLEKNSLCEQRTFTPTSPSPPLIIDVTNVARIIFRNADSRYGGNMELFHRKSKRILVTLQKCSQPGMVLVCGWRDSNDSLAKEALIIENGKDHMLDLIADIHSFDMAALARPLFLNVAKELGIEILNCDSCDDVAIARLARDRNGFVLSEQSDFCIFDVPGVLDAGKLTWAPSGDWFQAPFFKRRSLATKLNIDDSLLPLWASLCGNDFVRCGSDGVLQEFHDQTSLPRKKTWRRFQLLEDVASFLRKYVERTGLPCNTDSLARELHAGSPAKAEQLCNELRYSCVDYYDAPNNVRTADIYSPSHSALELMGCTAGPDGNLVCRTMPPRMVERFRCNDLSMVPTADFNRGAPYLPSTPYGYRIGESSPYHARSKLHNDALFILFQDYPGELVFPYFVPNLNTIEFDDHSVTLSSLRTADRECLPSIFTIYGDQPPSPKELRDMFTQRFGVTPAEATEFEGLFGELPDWSARLLNSCALKYYARECRELANEAEVIVFACCIARQQQDREDLGGVEAGLYSLSMDAAEAPSSPKASNVRPRSKGGKLVMADEIAEQHIFGSVNRWITICRAAAALHRVLDSPLGMFDPRLVMHNGREVFSMLNDLYAAGKAELPIPLPLILSRMLGTTDEQAKRMVGWIYTLATAGLDGFPGWDSIDCVALSLPHLVLAPLPQHSAAMPPRQAASANRFPPSSYAPTGRASAGASSLPAPPTHQSDAMAPSAARSAAAPASNPLSGARGGYGGHGGGGSDGGLRGDYRGDGRASDGRAEQDMDWRSPRGPSQSDPRQPDTQQDDAQRGSPSRGRYDRGEGQRGWGRGSYG